MLCRGGCRIVFALCIFVEIVLLPTAGLEKKVVCRYVRPSISRPGLRWFQPEDIPLNLCSHILFRSLSFPVWQKGSYHIDDGEKIELQNFGRIIKTQSPTTPIVVTIDGVVDGSESFSIAADDPVRRRAFVLATMSLVRELPIDGVEIDWEWPVVGGYGGTFDDRQNLPILLSDLKNGLKSVRPEVELWFFGAVYPTFFRTSYRVAEICRHVDYVTLFTFGMRDNADNIIDVISPMHNRSFESGIRARTNVADGTQGWIDNGCPAKKLILSVGLVGRSLQLADPQKHNVADRALGIGLKGDFMAAGYHPYFEVCRLLRQPGWTFGYDYEGRMPYAYRNDQWLSYEDVPSVQYKMDLIESLGLAGALVHCISFDDFRGVCGTKFIVTNYIANRMKSIEPLITFAVQWT
ncbi:AGAP008566-PA-like protein [Anopheles sinensis]|uniref:AGAP008566-PA-like protein n=1 Tax=Anopheles sinensis TaxID=74873 RepID=A0A084VVY4_ANOSI|nr:AGAP008566-PA-like protein [Anopheles sinensis]